MVLIKCDECGADVSDKAIACPKYGNPIYAEHDARPAPGATSTGVPPSKPKLSKGRTPAARWRLSRTSSLTIGKRDHRDFYLALTACEMPC